MVICYYKSHICITIHTEQRQFMKIMKKTKAKLINQYNNKNNSNSKSIRKDLKEKFFFPYQRVIPV